MSRHREQVASKAREALRTNRWEAKEVESRCRGDTREEVSSPGAEAALEARGPGAVGAREMILATGHLASFRIMWALQQRLQSVAGTMRGPATGTTQTVPG